MCANYVIDSPILWASVVVYLLININGKRQLCCLGCPMEFVNFVVENSTKFNKYNFAGWRTTIWAALIPVVVSILFSVYMKFSN